MKNFTYLLVTTMLFLFGSLNYSYAQWEEVDEWDPVPPGERVKLSLPRENNIGEEVTLSITDEGAYDNGERIFKALNGELKDASIMLFHEDSILLMLTGGGTVLLTYNELLGSWSSSYLDNVNNNYASKIVGDDLYVMSYNVVYVSDAGYNWVVDTAGLALNGNYIVDIDIDNSQQVWLAAQNGLFTQQLNVMTWVKNTNYPSFNADLVYVDRTQNVWVTNYSTLRVTTDGGLSFHNAPSGLPGDYIRDVSDDSFGNIYVMYDSTLYYSEDGTQPFVKVSQGIPDDMDLFSSQYLFNDVTADTLIYLATEAGLYTSGDQGATWLHQPDAVKSEHANSVTATDDGRLLMTTNMGAFRMESANTWSKRYPQNGFIPGTKMYTANNGDVYLLAENAGVNSGNNFIRMVYKSTDDGTTFLPDTAGVGAADVGMSDFFTDENGVQHASGSVYVSGSGNFIKLWKKMPGQPWELDVTGLPASMGSSYATQCFGSGHNSKVYVVISNSGSTTIYSRPIAGGSWTSETVVFGSVIDIKGRNGIVTAGTEYGVMYNTGSGWNSASSPASISEPVTWSNSEVDNNGVVWGYFEIITNNASLGQGIYYTTDFVNWSESVGGLDSIFFSELTAIGDSVFALTRNSDGVYVLDTTDGSIPVSIVETAVADNIRIIPNPFSAATTMQFNLDAESRIALNVYNVPGQLVFSIPEQEMSAGSQHLKINLPNTSKGIFMYELRVNGTVYKGKMVQQ